MESSVERLLIAAYRDIIAKNNKALVANLLDFSGKVIVDVDTLEELLFKLTGKEHSISTSMKRGDGCSCCGGKAKLQLFDSVISIKPTLDDETMRIISEDYGISLSRTYVKDVVSVSRSRSGSLHPRTSIAVASTDEIQPVEAAPPTVISVEHSEKCEHSEKSKHSKHQSARTIDEISDIKLNIPSPCDVKTEPIGLSSDMENIDAL